VVICSRCRKPFVYANRRQSAGSAFCPECGAPLEVTFLCPSCGKECNGVTDAVVHQCERCWGVICADCVLLRGVHYGEAAVRRVESA